MGNFIDFQLQKPPWFLQDSVDLHNTGIQMVNMVRITALFGVLVSLGSAVCQTTDKTPAAPGLTYLYSLNCTLANPIQVGRGPHGTRVVIPITGGTFSGPKMSGTSLPALIMPELRWKQGY